jgi:branched-chain amino acid transport system permease protein
MAVAAIQTLILSLLVAGLYAAVAAGLALEWGVTRIVNFAHGEFVMLGAYITYFGYVKYHISPLLSALIAAVAMGLLSMIVYRGFLSRVLRGVEHDQLLATIGLSILLQNVATILWSPDFQALHVPDILPTLRFGGVIIPGNNLLAALVGVLLYLLLLLLMNTTRYGLQLRLAREDRELATYTGVNVDNMMQLSFVVGGAMAGAAGSLVALTLYVHPLVGLDLGLRGFAIIALGGLGNIPGALIGSAVLAVAEGLTGTFVPQGASWSYGVSFLLLILVLVFKPSGLVRRRG